MTLKSRVGKGGGGITLLDGWPPGGLKRFRGRVEGYCAPLRNTDGLAPPPATLVVAKKKRKTSVPGATVACQDPPAPPARTLPDSRPSQRSD